MPVQTAQKQNVNVVRVQELGIEEVHIVLQMLPKHVADTHGAITPAIVAVLINVRVTYAVHL